MGYLTTITIYNDGCDQILKHPEEFAEKVYNACRGDYTPNDGEKGYFGIGNNANLVTVQKPRHADDHTVYVHMGNTLVEMNSYSRSTERIMNQFPDFFKKLLNHMSKEAKALKSKISPKR